MREHVSSFLRGRIHDDGDEQGFTLIELLIVIVVLGILAAVTVFGLSGTASQSAQSACKTDVRTVEIAMDAFHANSPTGAWPTALTDLTSQTAPGGAPYLRTIPVSTHYTITLDATPGQVDVNGTNYDTTLNSGGANPCDAVK